LASSHVDACPGEHFDQSIDAEPLDFAPREVRDPRLGDVKELRGLRLRETSSIDEALHLEHQMSADTKMLRFDLREADGLERDVISSTFRHDYLPSRVRKA
jgi:hypothetical protein